MLISLKSVDFFEIHRFPLKQICDLLGSLLRSGNFVCFSVDLCLDLPVNPQISLKCTDLIKIQRFHKNAQISHEIRKKLHT